MRSRYARLWRAPQSADPGLGVYLLATCIPALHQVEPNPFMKWDGAGGAACRVFG